MFSDRRERPERFWPSRGGILSAGGVMGRRSIVQGRLARRGWDEEKEIEAGMSFCDTRGAGSRVYQEVPTGTMGQNQR